MRAIATFIKKRCVRIVLIVELSSASGLKPDSGFLPDALFFLKFYKGEEYGTLQKDAGAFGVSPTFLALLHKRSLVR